MTNEQIYQAFRKGSIEPLYKEVYPRLLLYVARLLGQEYAFLSEDCAQDAIYQTYLKRASLPSPSAFLGFLYSCAYNAAISVLRKQSARENYLSAQAHADEEEFLHSMIEQEMLDILYRAIDELPDKYKQLFNLSFEQGLKNAEIAQLLMVSESAVKKQKAHFIELMRVKLQALTDKEYAALLYFVTGIMGL